MSFLSDLNFGGGDGSGDFDWSQIGSTAVQGGTQNGGFDTGDAAGAALDAAASAIPFGSMVKGFLDELGLQRNIDNVFKYGLSSWGASTTPEEEKAKFAKNVLPWVKQRLDELQQSGDLQGALNEIDLWLTIDYACAKNLRDNHSKAKSTRLANDSMMKELKDLKAKVINGLKQKFSAVGVKITTSTTMADSGQFSVRYLVDGRDISSGLSFMKTTYKVDYSNVKKEEIQMDENGNVKKKSSGGLLALGAGILYAFKSGAIKI